MFVPCVAGLDPAYLSVVATKPVSIQTGKHGREKDQATTIKPYAGKTPRAIQVPKPSRDRKGALLETRPSRRVVPAS
jgi:hypothetical protein